MASTGSPPVTGTLERRRDTPPYVALGPRPQLDAPDVEIERVKTLARVLDRYYLDPILGLLIPGGGDVIGSLLGAYTVLIAVRRRISPVVIARMLLNLAADAVIGFVPLIGDLFDIGFKANQRNARLLEQRADAGGRATTRDWLIVVGAALAYVAVMALVIYGIVAIARALAQAIA